MIKRAVQLLLVLILCSCGGKQEQKPHAVARVGEEYLDISELKGLVPAGTSKQDSIAIVKAFIDRWASQKLMYNAAQVNLSNDKQAEYAKLIRQYEIDLYTRGYLEEVVKQSIDTTVTQEELAAYYNANKENFKTTGTLVRLRYIRLAKDHPKFGLVKSRFLSSNKKDQKALNDMAIQFKSYAFNDTTWVDMNQIYAKLPFITPENRDKYISGSMSYQYPDSADVYIVKVARVLEKNQVSPFEYIKPTLQQLIINNRKLELIKKFQKDITDDAIKNDEYEVYK